jgi:tripartite-type tricarboxylate transporter receptor subunit TctC
MKCRLFLSTSAAVIAITAAASAQAFASKPMHMVAPVAGSGAMDITICELSIHIGEKLEQNVWVENCFSAGGTVGSAAVPQAAPDGCTTVWATSGAHIANSIMHQAATAPLPPSPLSYSKRNREQLSLTSPIAAQRLPFQT